MMKAEVFSRAKNMKRRAYPNRRIPNGGGNEGVFMPVRYDETSFMKQRQNFVSSEVARTVFCGERWMFLEKPTAHVYSENIIPLSRNRLKEAKRD
jgi:hypothetical protein